MKIDFKQLELDKQKNKEERMKFIKFWVEYIKKNKDETWSEQQNIVINSQIN